MAKVEEPKVEKKQDPKAVISVDGVDYKYEDLSDEKDNKEDANN